MMAAQKGATKNRVASLKSCIGGLDHPIIIPIIYLLVLISAYYLPFATINYGMHTIAPEDILRSPVPIRTSRLKLDVQLYGVCGRQSRETLQRINQYMEILRKAGNRPEKQAIDEVVYDNRLQQILGTKLTMINAFLCGDEGIAHADRQYSTWVAAGLIVTLILIPAGALSLVCIVIYTLTLARGRDRRGLSWVVVDLLSNVISWLMIFASLLYVALTWQERARSNASYGSGYVIMSIASMLISARLAGILSREDFGEMQGEIGKVEGSREWSRL
jgi:hypothetical protein